MRRDTCLRLHPTVHARSGLRQLEARRDLVRDTYLPNARRYAAAGLPYYAGVVSIYERELCDLDTRIARKQQPRQRAA